MELNSFSNSLRLIQNVLVPRKVNPIWPNTVTMFKLNPVLIHVRMAERSKAPDSRGITLGSLMRMWVFWSTNVGVGSNPTSDKTF